MCGEVHVHQRPAVLDLLAQRLAQRRRVLGIAEVGRVEPQPVEGCQRAREEGDPLVPVGPQRAAGGRRELRLRVALGEEHEQRGGLEVRLAVDDERRDLSTRVEAQVVGALLLVALEVQLLEPVWRADFEQCEVHHHAGGARGVVKGVHGATPPGVGMTEHSPRHERRPPGGPGVSGRAGRTPAPRRPRRLRGPASWRPRASARRPRRAPRRSP
jgi:hypothetical protein